MKREVRLQPLQPGDRRQFITDNQRAFLYGATEEFGLLDEHFEEDGQIISRETIEKSIDAPNARAYRIVCGGRNVGGVVIAVDGETLRGQLELLFVAPEEHGKGIGCAAWRAVEELHPEVRVWETVTPYFEKRNIHFYVNRCGFRIVAFYHGRNPMPGALEEEGPDEMFLFEKRMDEQPRSEDDRPRAPEAQDL